MPTEIPPPVQPTDSSDETPNPTKRAHYYVTSGASWFDWVAGFTVLNSMIAAVGKQTQFGSGLGLSMYVDYFAVRFSPQMGTAISLTFAVLCGLALFGLGVFAKRRKWWAFAAGIAFLGFDLLILLASPKGHFFGILMHVWAIWAMVNGLNALRRLGAW